ncbi:hypothetical protein CJD36_013160 [Flavipsychrobacter stenotrophus]|uniref:Activator of Hsp90 ATPase homologue 1/2-like C-terminal domain-containing protein n=1 Tax=Flavipsychrobacter stenotrophus TaxID=2077091 RepID=A0A2S7SW05_9BACT|nr:SRPBCC domain-containing protein [Flavipsychrobacter stenotrophus]PQJ10914.1 hypothetical protein CJD36_013160 [Flavipsychrobacter stenotrophus]
MSNKLIAETQITIHAPAAEVWKAITTPATVKKYLMNTTIKTDWKEGSAISYEGEYEGKAYKDKGAIQKVERTNYSRVLTGAQWVAKKISLRTIM